MAPGGPRSRRPEGNAQSYSTSSSPGPRIPSGSSARGPTVDRDDAFKSIFGRTAAPHHLGSASVAGGASAYINTSQVHPPYASGGPRTAPLPNTSQGHGLYDAFAPPLPPTALADSYAMPGPSNYASYGMNGAPPSLRSQPTARPAVAGPRDPRTREYTYSSDTSGYGAPAPYTGQLPVRVSSGRFDLRYEAYIIFRHTRTRQIRGVEVPSRLVSLPPSHQAPTPLILPLHTEVPATHTRRMPRKANPLFININQLHGLRR
jgi:hypothetical protein